MTPERCAWANGDPLYQAYHDNEWGRPCREDTRLFEMLILEGAQAGLSWITILRKREHYRRVFDNFDADRIAAYTPRKLEALFTDPGIVRNRLKIESVVSNARAYRAVREETGSFAGFIWQFVGGRSKINSWHRQAQVPTRTPESDALSAALKKRGFKFVGGTICYAYMQAMGLVNDHLLGCPQHRLCQDV